MFTLYPARGPTTGNTIWHVWPIVFHLYMDINDVQMQIKHIWPFLLLKEQIKGISRPWQRYVLFEVSFVFRLSSTCCRKFPQRSDHHLERDVSAEAVELAMIKDQPWKLICFRNRKAMISISLKCFKDADIFFFFCIFIHTTCEYVDTCTDNTEDAFYNRSHVWSHISSQRLEK